MADTNVVDKKKNLVPLAELQEERKRRRDLQAKLDALTTQLNDVKSQVESKDLFAGLNTEDQEETTVKERLKAIAKKLSDREAALNSRETSISTKESEITKKITDYETVQKPAKVKELAERFVVDEELLADAIENGESEAEAVLRLLQEKGASNSQPSSSQPNNNAGAPVYDRSGTPGQTSKQVKDMNTEEFTAHLETQRQKAFESQAAAR